MNAKQMIEWVNESFTMSWGLPSLTLTQCSPLQVQNSGDCAELNIDDPDSDLDLEILDLEDLYLIVLKFNLSVYSWGHRSRERNWLTHISLKQVAGPGPSRCCFLCTWPWGWWLQSPLNTFRHSHPSLWLPAMSFVSSSGSGWEAIYYLGHRKDQSSFLFWLTMWQKNKLFPTSRHVSQLLKWRKNFSAFSLILGEVMPTILWKSSSEHHLLISIRKGRRAWHLGSQVGEHSLFLFIFVLKCNTQREKCLS